MPTLAIPLKDILTDAAERVDFAALPEAEAIARIKGIYGFLASEVEVAIRDGVAVITLPDAKANKASQALDKIEQATRAARSGNYRQAIRYYEEALKVLPDHTDARRDLAMCLFEMGNYDAAKQHLIRVLQLAPTDAGAYLVLGNLYYQAEQDYGSAERFYAAALDLEPDNPYVLNSYARLLGKRGRTEEALTLFEQAIERAPRLPTARLGLALALDQMDDDAGALAALEALFAQPVSDDPRHAGVYEEARRAYADLRRRRAAASTDETQQRLRRVLDRYRSETGIEVRLELDPTLLTDAKIELAWRTGRPYHAIKFAGGALRHIRLRTNLSTCAWRRRRGRRASTACLRRRRRRAPWLSAAWRRNCANSAAGAGSIPTDWSATFPVLFPTCSRNSTTCRSTVLSTAASTPPIRGCRMPCSPAWPPNRPPAGR